VSVPSHYICVEGIIRKQTNASKEVTETIKTIRIHKDEEFSSLLYKIKEEFKSGTLQHISQTLIPFRVRRSGPTQFIEIYWRESNYWR